MKVAQHRWTAESGWVRFSKEDLSRPAQLVLVFGARGALESSSEKATLAEMRELYPEAIFLGCSTAGEILDEQVTDDTIVVTAVRFDHSQVRMAQVQVRDATDSREAGEELATMLRSADLAHVFVVSDGLYVNGSELVLGIRRYVGEKVSITGGLAGDGSSFTKTLVLAGELIAEKRVAAIGFYGSRLEIGYGSLGGWDSFGPERLITRSSGNVLYELDDQSALALYTKYLGDYAADLPASGLLFPLALRGEDWEHPVVRTILAVDHDQQSMTFAGDVPEGSLARLMKANFERLIDGAFEAARTSQVSVSDDPDLAILISCVGRKLVLKQRVEEEVEGVREVLGSVPALTGYYSYGEICPFTPDAKCELHNQTMTITTFKES